MSRARILHVITVYNGRAFVPRAIRSARAIDTSQHDVDVLILDDASPEPGWSADLAKICAAEGALYYCTPRNLGIPRNCNLGLLAAVENGYDYVTINNSDVIFPKNLVNVMVAGFADPSVGSITAWSNNVSVFTLQNDDPDSHLASQEAVDDIAGRFEKKFGDRLIDTPAGISFCIMIPTKVVREVGLNDPIYGRGYCEETDWSLRSLARGYRICLTPATFVYHMGRGSNLAAGLVSGAHTTVPENEDVIDMRYPEFRQQIVEWERTTDLWMIRDLAIDALINECAAQNGYRIDYGDAIAPDTTPELVRVRLSERGKIKLSYRGFSQTFDYDGSDVVKLAQARFNTLPRLVNGRPYGSKTPASPAVASYPAEVWN